LLSSLLTYTQYTLTASPLYHIPMKSTLHQDMSKRFSPINNIKQVNIIVKIINLIITSFKNETSMHVHETVLCISSTCIGDPWYRKHNYCNNTLYTTWVHAYKFIMDNYYENFVLSFSVHIKPMSLWCHQYLFYVFGMIFCCIYLSLMFMLYCFLHVCLLHKYMLLYVSSNEGACLQWSLWG